MIIKQFQHKIVDGISGRIHAQVNPRKHDAENCCCAGGEASQIQKNGVSALFLSRLAHGGLEVLLHPLQNLEGRIGQALRLHKRLILFRVDLQCCQAKKIFLGSLVPELIQFDIAHFSTFPRMARELSMPFGTSRRAFEDFSSLRPALNFLLGFGTVGGTDRFLAENFLLIDLLQLCSGTGQQGTNIAWLQPHNSADFLTGTIFKIF